MATTGTPRTRTRQTTSAKADQTADEQAKANAAAEAKAVEAAEKKAKREAEAAERKAQRELEAAEKKAAREAEKAAEREAKEAAAAAERQELIDAGQLIETTNEDGTAITFTVSEPKKDQVAQRAAEVIEVLKTDGREVPVSGKMLAERFGGGTVQWVSFFGMLRVLGLVRVYRYRSGERGGSGLSYLWIGD